MMSGSHSFFNLVYSVISCNSPSLSPDNRRFRRLRRLLAHSHSRCIADIEVRRKVLDYWAEKDGSVLGPGFVDPRQYWKGCQSFFTVLIKDGRTKFNVYERIQRIRIIF
jgi:hypothetical protein